MEQASERADKKRWFWISICINLGFLSLFKYFDFFSTSFSLMLAQLGFAIDPIILNLILPVGISFYTFHGLSYVIDIYYGRIQAEKNFIDYSLFVSFFPLLVAGPIERATHLLPQLKHHRHFNYTQAVDGMRQILWGLFKKVVVADHCAEYANQIFNHHETHTGFALLLGSVFFAIQIYGDFSGYSDIALGTARLFGIELLRNFSFPYFSRDIAEFWRRWHISLTTWFRDYVYIPLGGSKNGLATSIQNTFIIFILSGFWHGANWTFILWGFLNALFFIPYLITSSNRKHMGIIANNRILPTFRELMSMSITFMMVCMAWVLFRSETVSQSIEMFAKIFSNSILEVDISWTQGYITIMHVSMVIVMFAVEWLNRTKLHGLQRIPSNLITRRLTYITLVLILLFTANYHSNQEFIYFQF